MPIAGALMKRARFFLEGFRRRGDESRSFFYGLEEIEPFSSLLFYRRNEKGFEYALRESSFLFADDVDLGLSVNLGDEKLGESGRLEMVRDLKKAVFCAVEAHTRRVSVGKVQCCVCGKRVEVREKVAHFMERHCDFLMSEIEANVQVLDEDNLDDMSGFFGKLGFGALVTRPTKLYLPWRENGAYISAPAIREVAESVADACEDVTFTYGGFSVPPLNRFMRVHKRVPPRDDEALDFDINQRAAEQLADGIFQSAYVSGSKGVKAAERKTEEPVPQTKPPWTDAELDVNTAEVTKTVHPVKHQPKYIPYLETVPERVRGEVVRGLVRKFVETFVLNQCTQITRPMIQNRKKQHQKQMKEEKLRKARDEERQRTIEMRKRRQAAIERMSTVITNATIHSYIRQELSEIFSEELTLRAAEADNEENQEEASNIPPVVVSGLYFQRHLNRANICELFGQYSFAVDDDGSPKIRYRRNGNRIDVLLYLSSLRDVNQLLAQKSMVIDYIPVHFSLDDTPTDDTQTSFTGQEVRISATAKHLDPFDANLHRLDFGRACPVLALDTFL